MRKILLVSLVLLVLVIPCVVSADTYIFYTSGNQDGYLAISSDAVFSVLRDGSGSTVTRTETENKLRLYGSASSGKYMVLSRRYFEFNSSLISSDATISSAKIGLYGHATTAEGCGSPGLGLTGFNPATNGTAVAGDYQTFLSTRLASDISGSVWAVGSYNNYTLNSDGLSYIKKGSGSWTNVMQRTSWDIDNITTGLTWGYQCSNAYYSQNQEHGDNSPLLEVVTGSAVSAPVASFTANKNFIRIPNLVTVTDTSTNTPTSWEWSWGDGSANSTTQNPTHQYKKRGKFPIVLTATNAGGSGTTAAYNVRVAGYEN